MLKGILLLVGLPLVLLGAEGLYQGFQSREQITLRCAEYVQSRPSARWLRLTDCDVDYLAAGFREADGRIQELLFPIRPAGRPRTEPAAVVAATRDPSVLALAQSAIGEGRRPDQEQFLVTMLKIVTALRASREIEGLGRAGIMNMLNTQRVLSGLSAPLTADAIVIDLHASPDLTIPAVETILGAIAMLGALVLTLRSKRDAAVPAAAESGAGIPPAGADVATTPDSTAAEAPPQVAAGSARPALRGVLLLNLPSSAEAREIESAPPLGSRADVVRIIRDGVPGISFDDRGQGVRRAPDGDLTIGIGVEDPVATAVARAEGSESIGALARLVASAGWRVYSARAGTFVAADELERFATGGAPS